MFEIEHLLRLDTNWNSGEESNQNLRKDLLARVAVQFELGAILPYEKQQNNSRKTRHMQIWKKLL